MPERSEQVSANKQHQRKRAEEEGRERE